MPVLCITRIHTAYGFLTYLCVCVCVRVSLKAFGLERRKEKRITGGTFLGFSSGGCVLSVVWMSDKWPREHVEEKQDAS